MLELSEVIQNLIISLATILGGIWAFWKWGFSEWLRQKKEIPAIDGDLSITEFSLSETKVALTLTALWNNRGEHPVYIDPKKTRIDVFEVSRKLEVGPLVPKQDLGDAIYSSRPFHDMNSYVLEPKTESTLKNHYILEVGKVYIFSWKLYRDENSHKKELYAWTKEMMYENRSR